MRGAVWMSEDVPVRSDFGLSLTWTGLGHVQPRAVPDDLRSPLQVGGWTVRADLGSLGQHSLGQRRLGQGGAGPVVCRNLGVVALLHGHLYGTRPQDLPELYRRHGAGLARQLEGNYVLVLLDLRAGQVWTVTDRIGSHKLYVAAQEGSVELATRADWPAFRRRPLDPAGVAGYLATGNMFNGLTLYQGVRSLDRATIHEVSREGLIRQDYWTLDWSGTPEPGAAGQSLPDLREELAGLLSQAVDRRLPAPGSSVALSLSGGYDSRGLLSLLSGTGREIETFSYSLGTQGRGTDTTVARRLAAQYGARHGVVRAYRGDLLGTLRRNAQWGQGVTHFCDEADAWAELSGRLPSDVFVGEQAFELSAQPLHTVPEQLKNHHLTGFHPLSWLRGKLPDGAFARLEDAWQGELDAIILRTLHWEKPMQRELALTLDQSLPYVLLPWRERYAGHAARVHTPYLDTQVLEFLQRVPLEALADKALFKDALRALDPELLRVPIASSMGYEANWAAELMGQREAVWDTLGAQSSRLDSLIDLDTVRSLLSGLTPPSLRSRLTGVARQHLGRFRHGPHGTRLFGPAGLRIPSVDVPTFLLRLLTLREAEIHSPALEGLDTWTPEMALPAALGAPPAPPPPHAAS